MPPRILVVGGGHNGLVCAAYLARGGARVSVLERRSVLGGACVTEELWPGYRVSRAAYVVSLFRPRIMRELELERFGLSLLPRDPSSISLLPDGRSLVLGADPIRNAEEVSRFSARDAARLSDYERSLERVAHAIEPLFDVPPPVWPLRRPRDLRSWRLAGRAARGLGRHLPEATRLLLSPARALLEEWFDSEPLRATLATDAVIGAWASPSTPGTGAVLFHHVMGSVTGKRGVWAYVRGGMGQLASALAESARAAGAEIRTDSGVKRIRVEGGRAIGVELEDGTTLEADAVAASTDPGRTFLGLVGPSELPEDFVRSVRGIDFRSPVFKINLALDGPPPLRFAEAERKPALSGTIHLGCLDLDSLDRAFEDAQAGRVSTRPVVELTVPSVLDPSVAPAGKHLASIFAQYTPALPPDDERWPALREAAASHVLDVVEEAAPGFRDRILQMEVLAAPDLEYEFGLTGGNIFHGAMTPDRLLFSRPFPGWAQYRTPVENLYLCGAGAHPGGGVMGACGRNAAQEMLADLRGVR
jgi:phytoene dehydrogenase-like protein